MNIYQSSKFLSVIFAILQPMHLSASHMGRAGQVQRTWKDDDGGWDTVWQTDYPTEVPTTYPTPSPTDTPTFSPSEVTEEPTHSPTSRPTPKPTNHPVERVVVWGGGGYKWNDDDYYGHRGWNRNSRLRRDGGRTGKKKRRKRYGKGWYGRG